MSGAPNHVLQIKYDVMDAVGVMYMIKYIVFPHHAFCPCLEHTRSQFCVHTLASLIADMFLVPLSWQLFPTGC